MNKVVINPEVFRDKVMGCWLGKNAGGTLGEPFEEKFGRDEMFDVHWYTNLQEGGVPNDDLEMQLIWLQKLLEAGPGITSEDLIDAWLDCVSYNFDEYGLSKTNMKKGLLAPVCGWHNNAFRDCMGSPIRSELWACVAPGRPDIAARYAFQDAICDHGGGESVYGEVYNAVVQSAAFVESDALRLIDIGLSAIPVDCLTARSIRMAVECHQKDMPFPEARNRLKDAFYNAVSQYSPLNLGFQTLSWLYAEDFGDALCRAVNCGWDTDCTAATIGATLGIIHGAKGLPEKWIAPLGKTISTNMTTGGIRNLSAPTDIDLLTDIICQEAVRVLHYWNVSVKTASDGPAVSTAMPMAVERAWMRDYQPDTLHFKRGGFDVSLRYRCHAAILADEPSDIILTIRNPHPDPLRVNARIRLPWGFSADVAENVYELPSGGTGEWNFHISAAADAIQESNLCEVLLDCEARPAMASVPLVLLGGSRWCVSKVYHGASLTDKLGVDETSIFTGMPEGFHEVWYPGNDLCLESVLHRGDVMYLLHAVYSDRPQDIVVGVPNTGRMRLWQNGRLLHETTKVSPLRANQGNGNALGDLANYKVTQLEAGLNQFLIKLEAVNEPCQAHFTLGGIHPTCAKNHGETVLGIHRSALPWQKV